LTKIAWRSDVDLHSCECFLVVLAVNVSDRLLHAVLLIDALRCLVTSELKRNVKASKSMRTSKRERGECGR